LFHLDFPSVTVVVRTQNDPGTGPQFTYLPPHVALDPVQNDALTMRRKQVLDMLEHVADPGYPEMVLEMIEDLDFERGFLILQNGMGHLKDLGAWDTVLSAFQNKHGDLASGIEATLEECVRRDVIKDLRRSITDPEHRFFLALLMNVATRSDLLLLVSQRYIEADPVETVLTWLAELAEPFEDGLFLLDATFASEAVESMDDILSVMSRILQGEPPGESVQERYILESLKVSCLRVILTP
jgi:hypothetical protein